MVVSLNSRPRVINKKKKHRSRPDSVLPHLCRPQNNSIQTAQAKQHEQFPRFQDSGARNHAVVHPPRNDSRRARRAHPPAREHHTHARGGPQMRQVYRELGALQRRDLCEQNFAAPPPWSRMAVYKATWKRECKLPWRKAGLLIPSR